MKLLACGCLHGKVHSRLKQAARQCDAVLCAGDLAAGSAARKMAFDEMAGRRYYTERQWRAASSAAEATARSVMKFFRSLGVPVILVAGNNDVRRRGGGVLESSGSVKLLKSRIVRLGSVYVAGISHSHMKSIDDVFSRIAKPRSTIMLAHDVPYGVFDKVLWRESPAYGRHIGDARVNKNLKRKRLLAYVCAHMHEYQGMRMLHGTPVINTGYGRIGRHAVIEVENKTLAARFIK